MQKMPRIAVVGGGPAGLTAAVILHKQGHQVTVYETDVSPDHRKQGGTLDLHEDKGQVALRHAGLLDAFRAIARHEDQENKNVDPVTGLVEVVPPHPGEELDRPEIDRGVLRELLLAAVPNEAIVWNSQLRHLDIDTSNYHRLSFTDGRQEEADVVIGADGAWSKVRKSLTPTLPFYTGVTFLEGWIEKPTLAQAHLVGRGSMFSFGGPEAIFAQRNGTGRICVYAAVKRPSEWLEEQRSNLSATDFVQKIYQAWSPNLVDLLSGCVSFSERPIYSLPADFSWPSSPGISLIGDAAHLMPPVGLGVNLTMQDAAELAMAMAGTEDWQSAIRLAEIEIRNRAQAHMREAIPGFSEWFAAASPFAR